jgi:hypothetical protein
VKTKKVSKKLQLIPGRNTRFSTLPWNNKKKILLILKKKSQSTETKENKPKNFL